MMKLKGKERAVKSGERKCWWVAMAAKEYREVAEEEGMRQVEEWREEEERRGEEKRREEEASELH